MILVIDNYDSFTYNLVQFIGELGADPVVHRNDRISLEEIDELEPTRRGTYAGAVGYLDFAGNLDTCIAIRTLQIHKGVATVQAGAGIVADSVPENEYFETIHKASALYDAIRRAELRSAGTGEEEEPA